MIGWEVEGSDALLDGAVTVDKYPSSDALTKAHVTFKGSVGSSNQTGGVGEMTPTARLKLAVSAPLALDSSAP